VDLRYILLLLGLGVIAIVAVTAYFKVRAARHRATQAGRHGPVTDGDPADDISDLPPAAAASPWHFAKRAIQVDDAPPVLNEPVEVSALAKELEDLEQSANLTLDLTVPDRSLSAAAGSRRSFAVRAKMDDKIDFIMNLPITAPVIRDHVLGIYKQNEYLLERPHHIYGQQAQGDEWVSIEHDPEHAEYRDLALTVQMADMNGPIDESELNTFSQLGLKLADALGCPVRFSMSFEEAMARGRELDEFCRAHDVIASINIVSRNESGFSGRVIDQAAHRVGMEFGPMNIYHLKNNGADGCRNLFSLANLYQPGEFDLKRIADFTTDGLTLFMSVPRAANPPQVFEKMVDAAKALCRMLGGELRDQQQRPLSEPGLLTIRAQIAHLADEMRVQGIGPGSPAALRLF
jgi:cell division protein ZipA